MVGCLQGHSGTLHNRKKYVKKVAACAKKSWIWFYGFLYNAWFLRTKAATAFSAS